MAGKAQFTIKFVFYNLCSNNPINSSFEEFLLVSFQINGSKTFRFFFFKWIAHYQFFFSSRQKNIYFLISHKITALKLQLQAEMDLETMTNINN